MTFFKNIKKLLTSGETETVEYKANFGKETIITVNAMANTKGGNILVGVGNSGEIIGANIEKETIQKWINEIKVKTSPSIIVDIEKTNIDDKNIAVIKVDEFPIKPVALRGRYYKRVGNSNHLMDINEISNLYLKVLQRSWDSLIFPDYNIEDLDKSKIIKFIQEVKENERFHIGKKGDLLKKLNLLKNNQPTAASLLLFAKEPLMYNIHIGRFRTPSSIIDDRQIRTTLFNAVEETMTFIKNYVPVSFHFNGNAKREEVFDYPIVALREAILNAIVHRDYSIPGDIQIKIFDDKISIFNPGKLLNLTVQDLERDDYPSQIRNILIAESFYLTKNIEKYGSGFIRIREEIKARYDNVSFKLEERSGGVFQIFYKTTPKTTPKEMSEVEKEIIDIIRNNKQISKIEIGKQLGITEDGVKYHIRKLSDKNILKWEGTPRSGAWDLKIKTTPKTTPRNTPKTTPKEMSEVEREIIGLIQKNNQISKIDIGKHLGITEDGVKYHIRKLSEKNILKWEGTPRSGAWDLKIKTTPKTTLKTTLKTTPKEMSEVEREIIGLIQKNNQMSKIDIGKHLGITEDGVKYHIRKLSKKNILKWVGAPKTGKWNLIKGKK